MSLFLKADACLNWSLPSVTVQQVSPTGSYAVMADKSLDFSNTPHIGSISNLAILRNNYISLLSDLCTCVHVKKQWHRKGSHSSSVSGSNPLGWLKTCEKAMVCCTAQWKMLFCAKTIAKESHKFELARLKKKKTFWSSGSFLVWYFRDAF